MDWRIATNALLLANIRYQYSIDMAFVVSSEASFVAYVTRIYISHHIHPSLGITSKPPVDTSNPVADYQHVPTPASHRNYYTVLLMIIRLAP